MTDAERFLGLSGYCPRHVTTVAELLEHDGERLRALKGERLVRSFAMWDTGGDRWFKDGPVVLDVGPACLEVAAFKLHLCVSWDQVDVGHGIDWYGGSVFRLGWRTDALSALRTFAGHVIDEVIAVEYRGALNGIAFRSERRYVELFNALDELGVRTEPERDDEIQYIAV